MGVFVDGLEQVVIDNASSSDEIAIISGYCSPDTIEKIASLGKKLDFYFGMASRGALTPLLLNKLQDLQRNHANLNIFVVSDYHVHTKCYIFKENGDIKNILVGSANCSINGLRSGKNSELLVDLNKNELINQHYLNGLDSYCLEVAQSSLPINSSQILVSSQSVTTRSKGTGRHKYKISKNPFVALIPLFRIKGNKKVVPESSGLNWGNQKGHTKKGSMESYFGVTAELIDNHPIVFPFKPQKRNTTSGKITRDYDPITVLWDDGTVMEMIFSGGGVERPTEGNRTPNDPYRQYPKHLTSADGGGAELGAYIRRRMGLPSTHKITMSDLNSFKNKYVVFTYIQDGYYEASFSN